MSLFKRGNVYWSRVVRSGQVFQKSLETTNRRRAESLERDYKDELGLKAQLPELAPEMTFGALSARFIANADPKPYHIDRLNLLLPFFADFPIGRINKNTAKEYRKYRHAKRKLTETTINRDLECLRHILYWAADEGLIVTNPLARVPMVRERRKKRLVMTVEEEAKLIAAASPHLQKIIMAALDTGMRRGEILSQRFEDLDLSRHLLFVTHSKTAEGEAREIPLTKRMQALLTSLKANDGTVFTFEGRAITRIKTGWKAAIRRAGIRYYRFHDLRHTFNSRLMLAGVQQEIRKAIMGHSSGEDVNSIYTHVELPAKIEAIEKLQSWLALQAKSTHTTDTATGESTAAAAENQSNDLKGEGHDSREESATQGV